MVEFAITVLLFLLLTFGLMEFVLLIFDLSRANEMTRQLSRLAITADPVCDIWDAGCSGSGAAGLSCPPGSLPGDSAVIVNLSEVDTSAPNQNAAAPTGYRMLERAQDFLPAVQASQIQVSYACSTTGSLDRPRPIPLVTVGLQNFTRPFVIGSFLGLEAEFTFPAFEVTRIGEDLYTEE
jgi:hypothetical protein